jgi:hypothetical protein
MRAMSTGEFDRLGSEGGGRRIKSNSSSRKLSDLAPTLKTAKFSVAWILRKSN